MCNKQILLAFSFISIVATEPIMAAVESTEKKVGQAESTFQTLKKDILSLFSRKGCTRKQKIRLGRQGLSLAVGTAVLASIYYYGRTWSNDNNKPGTPDRSQEPQKKDPPASDHPKNPQQDEKDQQPIKPPQSKEEVARKSPLELDLEEARRNLETLIKRQQETNDAFEEKFKWKLERADTLMQHPTWQNEQRAQDLRNGYHQLLLKHQNSDFYNSLCRQIKSARELVETLEKEIDEKPE